MEAYLTKIAGIITDLSYFVPQNLNEEKATFFADENRLYNPQFVYKKTDFPLDSFRKTLEGYLQKPQDEDERISQLVQERVRELILFLDLHTARDEGQSQHIMGASQQLWGLPSPKILQRAQEILAEKTTEVEEEQKITAQEIILTLEKALQRVDCTDWNIELVDDLLTRAQLSMGKKTIRLRRNATFSEKGVQKIIVHEIATHILRKKNGSLQPYEIFSLGTAQQLETEEGLATIHEEEAGVLPEKTVRVLALTTLAAHFAWTHSFSQTYHFLEHYVGEEKAFSITARIKRGITDTSLPGAFTKGHLYFTGYEKIKTLSEKDRELLMMGKISYIHLPLIKQLLIEGKVRPPNKE